MMSYVPQLLFDRVLPLPELAVAFREAFSLPDFSLFADEVPADADMAVIFDRGHGVAYTLEKGNLVMRVDAFMPAEAFGPETVAQLSRLCGCLVVADLSRSDAQPRYVACREGEALGEVRVAVDFDRAGDPIYVMEPAGTA